MAILMFKVQADYEKVVRLREEITRLENQLKSFGRNTPLTEIKAVEAKLAETRTEFTSLATEAAKADTREYGGCDKADKESFRQDRQVG